MTWGAGSAWPGARNRRIRGVTRAITSHRRHREVACGARRTACWQVRQQHAVCEHRDSSEPGRHQAQVVPASAPAPASGAEVLAGGPCHAAVASGLCRLSPLVAADFASDPGCTSSSDDTEAPTRPSPTTASTTTATGSPTSRRTPAECRRPTTPSLRIRRRQRASVAPRRSMSRMAGSSAGPDSGQAFTGTLRGTAGADVMNGTTAANTIMAGAALTWYALWAARTTCRVRARRTG
jgi:hypothetical protein